MFVLALGKIDYGFILEVITIEGEAFGPLTESYNGNTVVVVFRITN